MAGGQPYSQKRGAFVPTNWIWDIQKVNDSSLPPEIKELLIRLYQNLNQMALVLNIKDSGYYNQVEFVTGQLLFPNPKNNSATAAAATQRQIWRKVVNFGELPVTGTKSVAHGINCTANTLFVKIYGSASDNSNLEYIPLPYASPTLANNIELKVDGTNVTVITGSDRSNFNMCLIVLEYVQS
jgi:hypothetical protein